MPSGLGPTWSKPSAITSKKKFNTMDRVSYLHQGGHPEAWTFTQHKPNSKLSKTIHVSRLPDFPNSNILQKVLKSMSQPVTYNITDETVRNFLHLDIHSNKMSVSLAFIKCFLQTLWEISWWKGVKEFFYWLFLCKVHSKTQKSHQINLNVFQSEIATTGK